MPHASIQPQPHTIPFHATTPGFAIAKAWCERHKPSLAEALAAVADEPPLLPFEEFEEGDEELLQPLRRDALPLELTLILTFARALQAAGGQRPGAPAQLALVHGWGAEMVMQLDKLLRDDAIARAFLIPARDRPKILILTQDGSSESVQADRRKSLARHIAMALMVGRGAVVLGVAPGDLPADLRRLCALELRLPRPDRAMVAALLTLLFPQGESSLTPEALPPEDALARLSVLELTMALHAPSLDAALAALHRIVLPEVAHSQPGSVTGLAAVAGQDAAVSVLRRLSADIVAWRTGQLRWQAVPRSLIFHGPPGTGKTLMAQAFAIEAGLPLIATSFADCQKAGHMGDMLAALETAVAEAETRAPAVFFLDELDGFSSRLSESRGRNAGYMRGVITGLLRQIDRLMATEGVVLIGATNHLDAIDPAIRRAGRFDATLAIDPPDRAGLAQILRHHLDAPAGAGGSEGSALQRAIATAAERLVGTNGAEAAALARATLARVRETGAPLAEALLAELDTRHRGFTPTDQRRIALHEAGHVVVGVLSGLPEPQALRMTPHGGEVRWPAVPIHTFKSAQAELRMVMAGRAAEEVFLGTPSSSAGAGPDSDLAHATRLALRIETEWGLGDGGLIWHPGMPLTLQAPSWLREKIDHLLTTARAEARAVVATHRSVVEELAEALLEAREMKGEVLQGWVRRIGRSAHPARRNVGEGVIALDPG